MLVVGIIGSPKSASLSTALLHEALAYMAKNGWECAEVDACSAGIEFCSGCESCKATGRCVLPDSANCLLERIALADAVIIASPVYFHNVSAQLKRLFDRAQAFWHRQKLDADRNLDIPAKRPCVFIATAGGPENEKLFACARSAVRCFCAPMNLSYIAELLLPNTDSLSPSMLSPEAAAKAVALAQKVLAEKRV